MRRQLTIHAILIPFRPPQKVSDMISHISARSLARRLFLTSTAAVILPLTLIGCGSSQPGETAAGQTSVSLAEQTSASNTLPDFKDKPLYDAIIFARDNDVSYTVKDRKGHTPETKNTREWKVVSQTPSAGTPFESRQKIELTVENSK